MRKLIIFLCFLPLFVNAQFGWSGLSSNQWVSATDAQGSGITQVNPLPSTYQWLTKGLAMYYLSVDTSYFNGYDYNQFVPKSLYHGVSYNNFRWSYTGNPSWNDPFFRITVNGAVIVYTTTDNSGSFVVADGDYIEIEVNMNGLFDYGQAGVSVASTGGIAYNVTGSGYNTSAYKDFYYSTSNGIATIEGALSSSLPTYYNSALTVSAYKNNCGIGYFGSSVDYTVSAGTYVSHDSQDAADQMAIDDANTNAQNYANANGTCTESTGTTLFYYLHDNILYHSIPPYDYIIKVNGTIAIQSSSGFSYFSLSDGDILEFYVNKRSSESGFMFLSIMGSGLICTASSPGSIYYKMTYHAAYQNIYVEMSKNIHY